MERLINRSKQGDLGEASALEWLTGQGATVFLPFGHSRDVDLVAEYEGRLLRVQVKTTVLATRTPNGHERYSVTVATLGGNRSWSGRVKTLDASKIDVLFVLAGDGRRWLIPAWAINAGRGLSLGGDRYSEFEISPRRTLNECVYGPSEQPVQSDVGRGSVGVWRAERDCKFRALALSEFESHLPHQSLSGDLPTASPTLERGGRNTGVTRVSSKHQVTIPRGPFSVADLDVGDRIRVDALGPGELILRRIPENDEGPP